LPPAPAARGRFLGASQLFALCDHAQPASSARNATAARAWPVASLSRSATLTALIVSRVIQKMSLVLWMARDVTRAQQTTVLGGRASPRPAALCQFTSASDQAAACG
jgi:hypothetical protein